jgi:hypothetical protein
MTSNLLRGCFVLALAASWHTGNLSEATAAAENINAQSLVRRNIFVNNFVKKKPSQTLKEPSFFLFTNNRIVKIEVCLLE